ncbi:MAG: glycosyltransferase, partial [Lutibacter sp.]
MNIGMILDKTFPPDPRVENEALTLIKAGFNVYLFCLKYKNEPSEEIINGIHIYRIKSNKVIYKLSALAYTVPFYTWWMQKRIKKFIINKKIDVIHVHDITIAQAVFNANKKKPLKII